MPDMNELLEKTGVVPVVVLEDAADAIPVSEALRLGTFSNSLRKNVLWLAAGRLHCFPEMNAFTCT